MDQDIRIPTKWLLVLAEKIKSDPNFSEMKFISEGGNVTVARRTQGQLVAGGSFDVWDFFVNPEG